MQFRDRRNRCLLERSRAGLREAAWSSMLPKQVVRVEEDLAVENVGAYKEPPVLIELLDLPNHLPAATSSLILPECIHSA